MRCRLLLLVFLVAGFLAGQSAGAQDLKPSAPDGWKMEVNPDGGWNLDPKGIAAGKLFHLMIGAPDTSKDTPENGYEAAWKALAANAKIDRAGERIDKTLGSWKLLRGVGVITRAEGAFVLEITILAKDDQRVGIVVLSESADTFGKYHDDEDKILAAMVGFTAPQPAVEPSGGGGFPFEMSFPAGWKREDTATIRKARLYTDEYGRGDRILIVMPAEPIGGSIDATYARIWDREMRHGGIELTGVGYQSPETPQPLRLRINCGAAVYYEGGECTFPTIGMAYAQLYLVIAKDTAMPVLAVYGQNMGTSQNDRLPVLKFINDLKPTVEVSRTPLFQAQDVTGNWNILMVASLASFYNSSTGAYAGDASSGAEEHLSIKPDGTYGMSFVGKTPSLGFTSGEHGHWKLEDSILTFTPSNPKGKKKVEPYSYRVYGRLPKELLLTFPNSNRVPTDSKENGCTFEIASKGAVLLRYKLGD